MSIGEKIKRRLLNIEGKVKNSDMPELIIVYFDTASEQFIFDERYPCESGRHKSKKMYVYNLQDYIFPSGFIGTCIMDLNDAPISKQGLVVFCGSQIRKKKHIPINKGFTMEYNDSQDIENLKTGFTINLIN